MNSGAMDFLRPPSVPRAGWWLLGVGVVALASAVGIDRQWAAARTAAEQANAARAEAQRARLAPKPAPPPSVAERRWRQAQQELNRPWLTALRDVESATHAPIYLLSLSFERGASSIRLEAEAPSFDHALAYVQTLDDSSALSAAGLVSHEQVAEGAGAGQVRFAVAAHWGAR